MKKKFMARWFSLTLAILMVVSVLAGCGGNNNDGNDQGGDTPSQSSSTDGTGSSAEPVTIRFLHKGPKPDGWDAVYEKYLEMTKDTLNIELESNQKWSNPLWDNVQIFGGIVGSGLVFILPKLHIQNPVQLVLNPPMAAF